MRYFSGNGHQVASAMRYLLGNGHQAARGNLSANWAAFPAEHAIHQVSRGTRYLSGLSGNCAAYAICHWAVLDQAST